MSSGRPQEVQNERREASGDTRIARVVPTPIRETTDNARDLPWDHQTTENTRDLPWGRRSTENETTRPRKTREIYRRTTRPWKTREIYRRTTRPQKTRAIYRRTTGARTTREIKRWTTRTTETRERFTAGAPDKRSKQGGAPLHQLFFLIPLSVSSLGRFGAGGCPLGGHFTL